MPNRAPGVYLHSTKNTMRVYMNTYDDPLEYVDIENLPLRKWFNCVRDTSTDTILKVYKLTDNRPELTEFQSTLNSPSGEPTVGSGNFAVKK